MDSIERSNINEAQQGLDFIVLGIARSGTTAVAGYLSATHQFHCAHEMFDLNRDHSLIKAPRDFVLTDPKAPIDSRDHIKRKSETLVAYGNKNPVYHFRLAGIFDELQSKCAIVCFRDITAVAQSYNMRAANEDDSNWAPGRVGYFACADLAVLVKGLVNVDTKNSLLMPHKALADDWETCIRRVGSHIAPHIAMTFEAPVVEQFNNRKVSRSALSRPELSAIDIEAIECLKNAGVIKALDVPSATPLSDRYAVLQEAANALPNDIVAWVSDLTERHSSAESKKYLRNWLWLLRGAPPLPPLSERGRQQNKPDFKLIDFFRRLAPKR